MPRPDPKAPTEDQLAMFEEPTSRDDMRMNRGRGRHARAFENALVAAKDAGQLEEIDGALGSTLLAAAWSLDAFEAQNKPYGSTKLLSQIVEALREAHMTPDSRDTGTDDAIRALVDDLASADDETPVEL